MNSTFNWNTKISLHHANKINKNSFFEWKKVFELVLYCQLVLYWWRVSVRLRLLTSSKWLKMAVNKNKTKQQTLGTTKSQAHHLLQMSVNIHRITSSDLHKNGKWLSAWVAKCTAKQGLKSFKARKKSLYQ